MTLDDVVTLYRKQLPPGELQTFRIDPNDHLGIPVVDATFIPDHHHRRYNGVGYGATETQAQIGAFGELHEFMSVAEAFAAAPKQQASYRELSQTHSVIDPLTLVLPAGSAYTEDRMLNWTPVKRLSDDAEFWVPVEFVANVNADAAYPNQLTTAITNGCGAGDTRNRAILHGLLELLQRDGNCDSFRALDRGQVLDQSGFEPRTQALIQQLAGRGLDVLPKLARVTCGCVSVYVVGRDRSDETFPLCVTACGEAADPDFNKAIYKAVLECAASHSRKLFYHSSFERKGRIAPPGYVDTNRSLINLDQEEPRALRAMVNWLDQDRETLYSHLKDTVFSEQTVVDPATLPSYAYDSIDAGLTYVMDQLQQQNLEAYYFAATPADGLVQVTKVIVPGIEMELGSYHRLGYRGAQRLLARNDTLISREAGPGKARVRLTTQHEDMLDGPVWLDTTALDARIDPVYPLYREPSGHSAAYAYETHYFKAALA